MSTIRVAIRVHEGQAVRESLQLSGDLTLRPGEDAEVDGDDYAVSTQVACGGLVILGDGEKAPKPKATRKPKPAATEEPEFLQ